MSQLPLERAKAMLGAGAFLARVLNVRDPENRNRLQVQILDPSAIGSQDGVVWARVMVPFAGDSHGTLSVPEVGCEVLVIFLAGDSRSPVVLGDMWNGSDKSPVPLGGSSGSGVGCTVAEKAGMKISILEDSAGYTIQLMTPGQVPESVNRATPSLLVPAAAAPTSIRIDANGIFNRHFGCPGPNHGREQGEHHSTATQRQCGLLNLQRRSRVPGLAGHHSGRSDDYAGRGKRMVNPLPMQIG